MFLLQTSCMTTNDTVHYKNSFQKQMTIKGNIFLTYALFYILNSSFYFWKGEKQARNQEELKDHSSGQQRGRKRKGFAGCLKKRPGTKRLEEAFESESGFCYLVSLYQFFVSLISISHSYSINKLLISLLHPPLMSALTVTHYSKIFLLKILNILLLF